MSKLAIISALTAEARCFSPVSNCMPKKITHLGEATLFVSGMGEKNARSATLALIENGAKAIVSWGTAGGLATFLNPGDVIIPELVTHEAGQQFHTSDLWRKQLINQLDSKLTLYTDTLIQSDNVIASIAQKHSLYSSSDAIAVDMESAVIAQIAEQNHLPMLAIRVIVDTANESIPAAAISSVDEFGQTIPVKLFTSLLTRPNSIPVLARLGKNFKQAQNSLRLISSITAQSLAFTENLEQH